MDINRYMELLARAIQGRACRTFCRDEGEKDNRGKAI